MFPGSPDLAFSVTYSRPAPDPSQKEWHQVFVDPYDASVQGQRLLMDLERPWRGSLFDFILRIHQTLALGATGATLVGIIETEGTLRAGDRDDWAGGQASLVPTLSPDDLTAVSLQNVCLERVQSRGDSSRSSPFMI